MSSETSASHSSPKRTAVDDDEPEPDVNFSDYVSEHDSGDSSSNDDTTSDEQEPKVEQERIQEGTGSDKDEGSTVEQGQVVEEEPEPDVSMLSHDTTANASTNEEEEHHVASKIGGLQIDGTGEEGRQQTGSSPLGPTTLGGSKSVNWTEDTKDAATIASSPTKKSESPKSSKSPQRRKSRNKKHHAEDNKGGDRRIKLRNPYPQPAQPPPSRSPEEIIADHMLPSPELDPPNIVPNERLSGLLDAARSPSLARRANAVGALRVLASQPKMPIKLVRTQGVLDVLVFAASHKPEMDEAFGIGREEYNAALDARTRSVSLMLLLCQPKENRLRLCHHPGLLDALVKVMEEDTSEARMMAFAVVATCAKTRENRQEMANTQRLITMLSKVLGGEFNVPKGEEEEAKNDEDANDKVVAVQGGVERLLSMDYEEMKQLIEEEEQKKREEEEAAKKEATKEKEGEEKPDGDDSAEDDTSFDSGISSRSEYGTFDDDSDDESRGPADDIRGKTVSVESYQGEEGMREQNLGKYEEFLSKARINACAALLHLSKHCPVSPILCANDIFVENSLQVGAKFNDPIHTRCIELLCMVTRFPGNTAELARRDEFIDTLLRCGKSKIAEDRSWALRALQNLTAEPTNKAAMAVAPVLELLRVSALRKDCTEEQMAAASALVNISTEPGAVVPLTSTPNVVATLVTLAHSNESSKEVCDLACEALANMGLWLQNLASTGTVPDGIPNVPLPTHTSSGWRRWENAVE